MVETDQGLNKQTDFNCKETEMVKQTKLVQDVKNSQVWQQWPKLEAADEEEQWVNHRAWRWLCALTCGWSEVFEWLHVIFYALK